MSKQYMTPVAAGSIELGPIQFNIYATDSRGCLVLFCRAGYEITPRLKEIMRKSKRVLYISSQDVDSYYDYAFERVERIVANQEIRVQDKAEILHGVGKRTVKLLLENPRSGQSVDRSKRVVTNYVDLILKSPEAASHLFALSAADAYTFSHSVNVCTFSMLIGRKILGEGRLELKHLGLGGLMHDVGKTMVDQEILTKTGPLTREEMDEMRRHPLFSYELISEHQLPEPVLEAGLHHHERADGTGYPDGLLLAETHPYARIVAVADVYDAITSDRVYRKGKPHVLALEEMSGDSKIFDREAFQALLQVVLQSQRLVDEFMRRSFPSNHPQTS